MSPRGPGRERSRAGRVLRVATDCSGMETPVLALRNLRVNHSHVFSSDINPAVKKTIMANCPPKIFYDDLTERENSKAPAADLYVAGFPCQPFSSAGLRRGFGDKKRRGKIFFYILDYLQKQAPRAFVLENVSNLVTLNGGRYYKAILKALDMLGTYNVYSTILDTKEHGVPQHRRRVYFVGICKSCDDGKFAFPAPVPCPSIENLLEPRQRKPSRTSVPPPTQGTATANVRLALKTISSRGHDPLKEPFVVDVDSSSPRLSFKRDCSPCLTLGRYRGHWITNRMRRMTKAEMLRLQGIDPSKFKTVVTERQLGNQIGNAMSVNVLERLFVRLLPAARLVLASTLRDRWHGGAALSRKRTAPPAEPSADKKRLRLGGAGPNSCRAVGKLAPSGGAKARRRVAGEGRAAAARASGTRKQPGKGAAAARARSGAKEQPLRSR